MSPDSHEVCAAAHEGPEPGAQFVSTGASEMDLWLRMRRCTTFIDKEIDRRFRSTFGVSLARFDFLSQLCARPAGLRMNELTRNLMVTGGSVTGLTDELVRTNLVERLRDPDDRRAFRLRLTADGSRVFGEMALRHRQWIFELMQGAEIREILDACRSLRAAP